MIVSLYSPPLSPRTLLFTPASLKPYLHLTPSLTISFPLLPLLPLSLSFLFSSPSISPPNPLPEFSVFRQGTQSIRPACNINRQGAARPPLVTVSANPYNNRYDRQRDHLPRNQIELVTWVICSELNLLATTISMGIIYPHRSQKELTACAICSELQPYASAYALNEPGDLGLRHDTSRHHDSWRSPVSNAQGQHAKVRFVHFMRTPLALFPGAPDLIEAGY
jgi:hypothetical protein